MADLTTTELLNLAAEMTESQKSLFLERFHAEQRDRTLALIFSLLFGSLGIDRFYLGDITLGVLKLITFGGFGIWTFLDWFFIMGCTDRKNRILAREIADAIRRSGVAAL